MAALFPLAAASVGMRTVLGGFAVVCVVAWVVVLAFVPETKGIALEEIAAAGDADSKKRS